MDISQRFWSKVQVTDTCWLWVGCRHKRGYGQFKVGRDALKAHRVSYELSVGPIPQGLCVLHRCDNPPCVNPAHLFLGTQQDNIADCCMKGRATKGFPKGPMNPRYGRPRSGALAPSAVLTASQVNEIRSRYEAGTITQLRLCAEYGVSRSAIQRVLYRKTWVA